MKSQKLLSGATLYGQEYNALRADARAASYLLAHQQTGYFTLGTNPTNGQTITFDVNGTNVVLTGKTGTLVNPGDFSIGASAAATVANLYAALINPTVTTATFVGLNTSGTAASAILLQYLGYGYVTGATVLTLYSLNNSTYAPLTSFTGSTTFTSGTWTTQTMQLYVEPGTYYISGTRYFFLGGSTTTVTAPSGNPRIDVLSINASGTLGWTTGTENASPVAPTYPANQVPICELYNVVSETALYDNDNQTSGGGYIYNDVRPMIQNGVPYAALPANLVPAATDTYDLGTSSSAEWLNVYAKNIYASAIVQQNGIGVGLARFGGTGTDGALSITSGTTTLSFASAQVLVKNYSSISITGTGALTFSNPNSAGSCAILKCSGNATITSSATAAIYVDGMGAAGGTAGNSSLGQAGNGQNAQLGWYKANGATASAYGAGSVGTATNPAIGMYTQSVFLTKYYQFVFAGGGGLGGCFDGSGGSAVGAGGAGGGALVMEVGGTLDFTGTITANGLVGGNTSGYSVQNLAGGGGAGGSITILYNLESAITGTLTAAGGYAGTATGGSVQSAGSGGATPFTAGSNNGSNAASGAAGQTNLIANTEFS